MANIKFSPGKCCCSECEDACSNGFADELDVTIAGFTDDFCNSCTTLNDTFTLLKVASVLRSRCDLSGNFSGTDPACSYLYIFPGTVCTSGAFDFELTFDAKIFNDGGTYRIQVFIRLAAAFSGQVICQNWLYEDSSATAWSCKTNTWTLSLTEDDGCQQGSVSSVSPCNDPFGVGLYQLCLTPPSTITVEGMVA